MFKELFTEANDKKQYKVYVGSHGRKDGGLDMLDLETGEAETFKNMKDLLKKVQSNPRDYSAFFRDSSRIIRAEANAAGEHYGDSVEPVAVRIEVYPSWAKSIGIKA